MSSRRVGPVLSDGVTARAVASAIQGDNEDVVVVDRGGYLRVSAPSPCVVSRVAIEGQLGRRFSLRTELEPVMVSFQGLLELREDEAKWL